MKAIISLSFSIAMLLTVNTIIISVDASKNDNLKLSDLSSNTKVIPLETNTKSEFFYIVKVALTNNYIFILAGDEESKGFPVRVFKYDWQGHFVSQVGLKNNKTKDYEPYKDMLCDEKSGMLFLKNKNNWQVFHLDGSFIKTITMKDENFHSYFYQNNLWTITTSFTNGKNQYNLSSISLDGKITPVSSFDDYNPEYIAKAGVQVFSTPSFSVHNNKLYISFGCNNSLNVIEGLKLKKEYQYSLENCEQLETDRYLGGEQGFIGDYLILGYAVKANVSDYIVNTKTNQKFNVKYRTTQGKFTSGIKDDIYQTGYFSINRTNRNNCFFFVKNTSEVGTLVERQKTSINSVLFVVQL